MTDSAKQSAIDAITLFQNSDFEKTLIYHGQDSVSDYSYYLEIRNKKLFLVIEIDYGMKIHNDYEKIEEILYQFDKLEKLKSSLVDASSTNRIK